MRLGAALRLDALAQSRNRLYAISIAVAAVGAAMLGWLSTPERLVGTVPLALLAFVGGSTLLYVVAMLVLERADGTLAALLVSPLRPWEYLTSKVLSLTAIALLEAAIVVGGAWVWLDRGGPVPLPNVPLLVAGVVALGAMHVLAGVVLAVPHPRLMDVLVPMSLVALFFQLPAAYFVGAADSPWLLLVPTGPATMLVRGAFVRLEPWQWVYAVGGSLGVLGVLAPWSLRRFETHVTRAGG